MGNVKFEFCEACDGKTGKSGKDSQYTEVGDGPFCDTCWFFMLHIEALRDRVTDIEKKLRESVNNYDCLL